MRSLPVLLIALALLPLADAMECYAKAYASGFPADIQKSMDDEAASVPKQDKCKEGVDTCVKITGSGHGASFETKMCDYCVPGKCESREEPIPGLGKISATACCCKGNLCNPATAPTALLSLAAAAAVLAARF